jgi:maleate isomerase
MPFSSWRGTFGIIQPTMRPVTGGLEDLIRLLPRGVGVIALYNGIREGTRAEFERVIGGYETKTAELAEAGADLIHPGGAPPFMLLGYAGEAELMRAWEGRYGVPCFTAGQSQVGALRALKAQKIVGVSYFRGDLNDTFRQYFTDAGFDVLDMRGMDVDFDKVQELSSQQVYKFAKSAFLANPSADAIYMLGTAWPSLDIVQILEMDCGVPVVHSVPAKSWEIQRRLHLWHPVQGFGALLADLPPLPGAE